MVAFLPWGRHKGVPLPDVPTSYLQWALRECRLSSGLRAAVAGELARRGIAAPPLPTPRPVPPCRHCGTAGFVARWQEDRRGARRLRAECAACRRWRTFLPEVPPYLDEANAATSETAILDVLTQLDALGIPLVSDGHVARVPWPQEREVPADLAARLRECSHHLALLLPLSGVGVCTTPDPQPLGEPLRCH